MVAIMKFKAGDTFDYSGPAEIVDYAGSPVAMNDWTLTSKVRFPDQGRVVALSASWLGSDFTHVRVASLDTDDWPPGPADIDIEFTSPAGVVVSTPTLRFCVEEDLS